MRSVCFVASRIRGYLAGNGEGKTPSPPFIRRSLSVAFNALCLFCGFAYPRISCRERRVENAFTRLHPCVVDDSLNKAVPADVPRACSSAGKSIVAEDGSLRARIRSERTYES